MINPEIVINEGADNNSPTEGGCTFDGDGLPPIHDDSGIELAGLLRDYAICTDNHRRFWTEKLLRHILTRSRVEAELRRSEHLSLDEVPQYVNMVHPHAGSSGSKTYLRIFSLLLLSDRVDDFAAFVEEGVCDEELPLEFPKGQTRRSLCLKNKPNRPLQCFRGWKTRDKEFFEDKQWEVCVPFFDLEQNKICKEFHLQPRTIRPWSKFTEPGTEFEPRDSSGAYGTVCRVRLHPTSHGFRKPLSSINLRSDIFAIKTLREDISNNEAHFRHELDQLKRFNGFVQPHLVTCIGGFKFENQWHFIFPSALCNLEEYLERPKHPWNRETVLWASKQLAGIMGAVDAVHNPKNLSEKVPRFGRHGDIKRDNILCFRSADASNLGTLVLSDFGLSSFNRDVSRSNIPNEKVPAVPGYRPPECDIKGGTISRDYDIWTEFMTRFQGMRTTDYITGSKNDIFFVLKKMPDKNKHVAQVKPEVTEWIQWLRGHDNCSQFIHDVLGLIEQEMLVVLGVSRKRSKSPVLLRKFQRIQSDCEKDGHYCTKGLPDKSSAQVDSPAVEANLNETAKRSIRTHRVELPVHHGVANDSMSSAQLTELRDR